MTNTVTASDGTALPLGSLAVTIVWSGGFVSTMSVVYASNITGLPTTYTQTYTNNGTNITHISEWVAS